MSKRSLGLRQWLCGFAFGRADSPKVYSVFPEPVTPRNKSAVHFRIDFCVYRLENFSLFVSELNLPCVVTYDCSLLFICFLKIRMSFF